jgi:hypothetical protein
MSLFTELSGARFSSCMKYRFELWRQWDEGKPYALFVMLNPSTADEVENDPTVERCQRRALSMGYGGVRVANIFAFRSTDPQGLYVEDDPVGVGNDEAIVSLATEAGVVICAWGTHGNYLDRGKRVLALLRGAGVQPFCLKLNADGTPKHPLYVGYDVQPVPMPD